MASTPFFFFSGLLFLAWFTADVHSVKVLADMLKGSSVVLRPDEAEKQIISITWKHGPDLAAEWFGGDRTFYNIFKDTCSLNTTTGELTINDVRPEHSGVYTPDINGKTRSAMKLQVFSPVPKPSITMNCNPEQTKCTLSCWFDRTDDLGDVEVFWIFDDSHERGGRKIQMTEDTKEKTFVCSLKNSVSSENSAKLQNPFLPSDTGVPVWIPVVGTLVSLASIGTLVGLIILKNRRDSIKQILKEICNKKLSEGLEMTLEEICGTGESKDVKTKLDADEMIVKILTEGTERTLSEDRILRMVHEVIMRILREGNKRNLSEDGIWMLLNARYLILSILPQRPEVQDSLEKVKDMIEKFFRGRNELWLYKDVKPTLWDVDRRISRILEKKNEFCLSKGEEQALLKAHRRFGRTWRDRKERTLSEDDEQKLWKVDQRILWILREVKKLNLSEDVTSKLQDVDDMISRIIREREEQKASEERQELLNDTREDGRK